MSEKVHINDDPDSHDTTTPSIPLLEQLVTFQHPHFNVVDTDNQYPWEDIETSTSLVVTNPHFPRRFIHSNNLVDTILPPHTKAACEFIQQDPKTCNEICTELQRIARQASTTEGVPIRGDCSLLFKFDEYYLPTVRSLAYAFESAKSGHPRPLEVALVWDPTEERFVSNLHERMLLRKGRYGQGAIKAVAEIRADSGASKVVYKNIALAVKTGLVKVDNDGRASITKRKVRKRLGRMMVDQVERLLTHMWCQLLHSRVLIGLLTSHECTLSFYVNNGRIEVSEVIHANDATLITPCRGFLPLIFALTVLPEDTLEFPPFYDPIDDFMSIDETSLFWVCHAERDTSETSQASEAPWWMGSYERHTGTEVATKNLSFSHLLQSSVSRDSMLEHLIPPETTPPQLGPPSLSVHLSHQYTFQRVKEEDCWHSLIRARRWPSLLHGPVAMQRMQDVGIPSLVAESGAATTKRNRNRATSKLRSAKLFTKPTSKITTVFLPQTIVVEDLISWGAVWDVFKLSYPLGVEPFPFPLIAKIVTIECFEEELHIETTDYDEWVRGGHTQKQIREKMRTELSTLNALTSLEPPIIPRVLGLWGGLQRGYQVWVMIMENAEESLEEIDINEDDW
ncbi:hypothetical protein M231_05507 [Tremella mesenterica]|uniref:Uncharacterized protein n=1 Tax=Tremella mesenterica TaxID=5217 RepID=A0A4V1M3K8_TREME|nr:hypothetical protein M231_05507 [Tremella mesenterica]